MLIINESKDIQDKKEEFPEKQKRYQDRNYENRQLVLVNKKRCNKCKEILSISEFSAHKNRIGGVSDECRSCVAKRNSERYKNARFGNERMKSLKRHAKKINVPFNITPMDLEKLWDQQKGLCYYTQMPMQFVNGSYNTVSVDRINPYKGYTLDNLCLCCDVVNFIKNNMSYETLLSVCKAVVEHALPLKEKQPTGISSVVMDTPGLFWMMMRNSTNFTIFTKLTNFTTHKR